MTEEPPSREYESVPRPLDLGVEATFAGDTLVLVNRRKQLAIGVFVTMFWIGWVGGIAGFAHQEGGLPWMAIGHVLVAFALPFFILNCFCKRETLELSLSGIRFERRVFVKLKEVFIPLNELRGFTVEKTLMQDEESEYSCQIEVHTMGKSVHFAKNFPRRELVWLATQLVGGLNQLRPSAGVANDSSALGIGELYTSDELKRLMESDLLPTIESASSPTSNRWAVNESSETNEWIRANGNVDFLALAGTVAIALFWNGIVSVFLYTAVSGEQQNAGQQNGGQLNRDIDWFLLLFLVPFLFIGCGMLAAVGAVLFEPFRTRTIRANRRLLTIARRGLGISASRDIDVQQIDRIERRLADSQASPQRFSDVVEKGFFPGHDGYELALIDHENAERAVINDLTFGEAGWLGNELVRALGLSPHNNAITGLDEP